MLRPGLVFLLTTLLLSVPFARAQQPKPAPPPDPRNIDGSAFGERIDLSSAWLFSPTDKPENASPALDDRSWITLTRDQMYKYDFHNLSIGWYRVHVHLPPTATNVVLELGDSFGEYQAFANGTQIGGPPMLDGVSGAIALFPTNYRVPDSVLRRSKGDLVLALRVGAFRRFGRNVGVRPGSSIHLASAEMAARDASYSVTHRVLPSAINAALELLVSLVALALYLAMRTRREYLGAAVVLFLYSAQEFLNVVLVTQAINNTPRLVIVGLLFGTSMVAGIEFVRLVLTRRLTRLIVLVEAVVFLAFLASRFLPLRFTVGLWLTVLALGPPSVGDMLELALLIPACRRRNPDALVLLPIMCLSFIDDFWRLCVLACSRLPHPIHLGELPSMHLGSYVFSFNALDTFLFSIGILLFLVLRAVRIARERARVGAELEAAQSMQQLLLSRSSVPTPGFDVDSVYLPASEVGGDFFLVSPDPHDGSLTALVGDVSGKGLQAAMRVSMILGMLRREDSRDPATILLGLNQGLHAQGGVGFTTACCVRLQANGAFAVAIAGHISPYVDGAEWETAPGLPLGLAAETEYEERNGQLGGHGRMVLTLQPAQAIAATAQAFGQNDDITVLSLSCTAQVSA